LHLGGRGRRKKRAGQGGDSRLHQGAEVWRGGEEEEAINGCILVGGEEEEGPPSASHPHI
jgi:hypothetical protein